MQDMGELLNEMRETFKSGQHKQILARMDDEISFGKVSPILRAVFQFMLGRTPAQHRKEAQRLRADSPELKEMAQFSRALRRYARVIPRAPGWLPSFLIGAA
jgi:hypothetical protein